MTDRFEDPSITDEALNDMYDRIAPRIDPAPWHPKDGLDRYYGMVFYWFDRTRFDIRIPLSVVNVEYDENHPELSRKFYIRWGGMRNGAFCIVVQEPRSIAKTIPRPNYPNTWHFRWPGYHHNDQWFRFPGRQYMRWGYVNIHPQQMFIRWWHTGYGVDGVSDIIEAFTYYRTLWLKEWPYRDPMYPLYQRVLGQLVKKEWQPRGSYFDLRKM